MRPVDTARVRRTLDLCAAYPTLPVGARNAATTLARNPVVVMRLALILAGVDLNKPEPGK